MIIQLAPFIRALQPVLGDRLGAPRDDLPSSGVHLRRRAADRVRSPGRGRPPDRYDVRDRAAVLLGPAHAVSRRHPRRLAWRRRLPYALAPLRRNRAIHAEYPDPLDGFRRFYFNTVLLDPRAVRFSLRWRRRGQSGARLRLPVSNRRPRAEADHRRDLTDRSRAARHPRGNLRGSSISIAAAAEIGKGC